MSPDGPAMRFPERDVTLRLGTGVGRANATEIVVRDHNLAGELIGRVSYTEMALLTITGRRPGPGEVRVADAVLVSLVDHGMQPSALAARLTYHVAPEAIQGAIAAGLLGAGSMLLGSMEQCGRLLASIAQDVAAGTAEEESARRQVQSLLDAGQRIPGIGHALHRHGDPRAVRLLAVAGEQNVAARQTEHLRLMAAAAAALTGRDLPINATGAAAALLLGLGIPWQLHRGFAIISRAIGLLAHIDEERVHPLTPAIRSALREASWLDGDGDEGKARGGA